MTTTNSVVKKFVNLVLAQARKASVAFVVASIPALVTLIQANYGQAVGAEVAAVVAALGVYKVKNS